MPTFIGGVTNNEIALISTVSIPGDTDLSTVKPYRTILDTGAQGTMISGKVVSEVGLTSIGTSLIVPASGESIQCNKFRIQFGIAITDSSGAFMRTRDMDVCELPYQPDNYDVLLGMDFLPTAHFTLHGGGFILSL